MERLGQPAYRSRQLWQGLYRDRIASLDQFTTLPIPLREELKSSGWAIAFPFVQKRFTSTDGTVRYLLQFSDGQSVETVWMPEGDGGEQGDGSEDGPSYDRATICVSSQVGCAVDCQFCMTALLGLLRNLSAGEIVGQILAVLKDENVDVEKSRINLVFMGQGEPFLNFDNFVKAVTLLAEAVGIPESRMTVSTSGIVPRIVDFGQLAIRPKLAISLNASNDESRRELMPITKKWTLEKLMSAAREFPLRNRERMTFEYVLLGGVNDSEQNAREVVQLLRGLRAKVNLIAWNPGPEIPFSTPDPQHVEAFQQILIDAGIPTFIRKPRGRDIFAACGQLKRTELVTLS
ncbi:23S rRNA m(2)A-2503 methyltransferase [Candidatus Koribacter versatilis Ellin345]|uniref:Probable dual-specificity RNA methyltransferase RlmN n=2 Tax=Candidatus Korobacter versatilis TaxID=658062 RepID=RLMN_KORVE|nr:RecName: Full=Probable dual-specificity RNA methyltransferase RlmN; AltName: Full=23S rRNA (adenine(2503)-C(2))-methyltransferase; AltName: Full=23S rRNA m2A2503 methyltransferase; AltName: Full=Ribosomal RNA large subunit methyltransferase N; AltName: Full=tRNA (adenine(37)-C(2))-methyltransferase; AltName: Full=tRNA m2A37 methyltransferase [Candidatus Koribacter versatilis Ellin345]ABF40569.1 23S rRNA m(2)A-2503 methyltransferase [Candidatus Koribacter versatilis Ellin345]